MNISGYRAIESYECTNKSSILQGVKEEYTTSIQSFKPVLDSYQTSTSSIDRTISQPGSYRTTTTGNTLDRHPGINTQPFLPLHQRSTYVDRPFQRKYDTKDCQEVVKSNHDNKLDKKCFHDQRALQDSEVDFQPDHNVCDNLIPPYRRQNLSRHSERMAKVPFRRFSSPPIYESDHYYFDDIQSNYQRQCRDSESSRHHNGSIRYSPLHSRSRTDNIFRRHSLRERYETGSSFSPFEANRDVSCDQGYRKVSGWNY